MADHNRELTQGRFQFPTVAWICLLIVSINSHLASAAEDYLLGGGDTVQVTVYEQPDLATTARISQDDGTITFPLLADSK